MRATFLLVLVTFIGPNLAVQTRSLKLIEQILRNFRKGKSQSSSWRSEGDPLPPQQDIYRPNSDGYGAPQAPVISRPNYSDDYGGALAPVIKSNQYGGPVYQVISRPNYSEKYGYNERPVYDYGTHYGGGRPLYTEDHYQPQYYQAPPACSCSQDYQHFPPNNHLVSPPPLPPPVVTTTPTTTTATTSRPSPCLELHTTLEFTLESPGLSVPGSQCEFIILPGENVCSLSLTFTWFFLPSSLNCTQEFLQISGNKLCGELTGRQGQASQF